MADDGRHVRRSDEPPGLAVLYASLVPKKWAVNVLAMMFAGFSLVMVCWFVYEYKLGFGPNSFGGGVEEQRPEPSSAQGRG